MTFLFQALLSLPSTLVSVSPLTFEKTFSKIDDFERLRPEELNQQNIEALVAENNLVLNHHILPVNDVDLALHNFVNKDDKMSFYSCVQYNLEETHSKIARDSDPLKLEEEDLTLKVGECLEARSLFLFSSFLF
ncbi:unnamed protein product, partial [Vitis vinifera]|uniref:Uncharacterized protein n=1 Tax=Vitis vinifera TaxID=29760 RepID=D7TYP3_VITVI